MREILFKAKKKDNREWIEGHYAVVPKDKSIISVIERKCDNPPDCDPMWQRVLITYDVDPKTVCQYTGQNDKNKKKIWENDIVHSDDGKVGQVQWFEEYCAFMIWSITENKIYFLYDNDFSRIEVIGNIFDNPELLKGA